MNEGKVMNHNSAAFSAWQAVCKEQNWDVSPESLNSVLAEFLNEHKLYPLLMSYMAERLPTAAELAPRDTSEVSEMLTAIGVRLIQSEFKGHFFEKDDVASIDFNTKAEALQAAMFAVVSSEGGQLCVDNLNQRWLAAYCSQPWLGQVKQFKAAHEQFKQLRWSNFIDRTESLWAPEHPFYAKSDWEDDVSNQDTRMGYWEWVAAAIDSNEGEEEHCTRCGCQGVEDHGLCVECLAKAELKQLFTIAADVHSLASFRRCLAIQPTTTLSATCRVLGLPEEEPMAGLLKWYEAQERVAAQTAYENYDFGQHDLEVVKASQAYRAEDGGWRYETIVRTKSSFDSDTRPCLVACTVTNLTQVAIALA